MTLASSPTKRLAALLAVVVHLLVLVGHPLVEARDQRVPAQFETATSQSTGTPTASHKSDTCAVCHTLRASMFGPAPALALLGPAPSIDVRHRPTSETVPGFFARTSLHSRAPPILA